MVGVITVTPAMASKFLEAGKYTRKIKARIVEKYTSLMLRGKWMLNGEPLIFDVDGDMVEGNHRCKACLASNKPFETFAVIGISHEAAATINNGKSKTPGEHISAMDGTKVEPSHTQVVTRMMGVDRITVGTKTVPTHLTPGFLDAADIKQFGDDWADGIDFACDRFRGNRTGLSNASMKAAVAKAFYHTRKYPGGRERLEEFCSLIETGETNGAKDRAGLVLREHLISGRDQHSHDEGIRIFLKTCYCLDKFMEGESIDRVRLAERDLFPLSQEISYYVKPVEGLSDLVRVTLANTPVATPVEAK